MTRRGYSEYKPSGVEWLGDIPGQWDMHRLKHVAGAPIKNGIGEAGAYDDPSWPRYVRITDIAGPRSLRDDTFKSLPTALAPEAPFSVGDILLAAVGATYGKSYLHTTDIGPTCFAGYLVRFSPGPTVNSGFAAYWTESATYWAQVQSRVVQATIQNFSAAKYRDLSIPLPAITEQRTIAAFLDRETARIDALIGKKERQIELLQEKRAALISHAVTKGLDPNVKMKDSGVEWLGKIPAHWGLVALRWFIGIGSGEFLANSDLDVARSEDRHIPAIGGNGLMGYTDKANVHSRSVVVGRVGAKCGNVHLVDAPAWITDNALVIHSVRAFHTPFLATVLRAANLNRWANQNAQPLVTGSMVKEQRLPLPPQEEQVAIAHALDDATSRLCRVETALRHSILMLREYRTALISAAVTGKIDVRGEVA